MVDGHAEWHDESVRGSSVDLVKHRLPHPRYIRSHLPFDLLPIDILNEDGSVKPKVRYILLIILMTKFIRMDECIFVNLSRKCN